MNKQTHEMLARLENVLAQHRDGQAPEACTLQSRLDANALRRISMTLHRWHELECGDSNGYGSWVITRGTKGRLFDPACGWYTTFDYHDDGKPYIERHMHNESKPRYEKINDREKGARKRLAKILAKYPGLTAYVQTDPRGAALYILRPGDVREGCIVDSCYSNGIAVYK